MSLSSHSLSPEARDAERRAQWVREVAENMGDRSNGKLSQQASAARLGIPLVAAEVSSTPLAVTGRPKKLTGKQKEANYRAHLETYRPTAPARELTEAERRDGLEDTIWSLFTNRTLDIDDKLREIQDSTTSNDADVMAVLGADYLSPTEKMTTLVDPEALQAFAPEADTV